MTWLLGLLGKIPFSVYVILCLFIVAGVEYLDIEHLHMDVTSEQASAQQAIAANTTNILTIKSQQASLDQWKQKCMETQAQSQESLATLKATLARTDNDNADMKQQLDALYEKDSKAKAWSDLAVPDDVAVQLRTAANR